MSRRRLPTFGGLIYDVTRDRFRVILLRPVEAARHERVRRQIQRVKRRAARRWPA